MIHTEVMPAELSPFVMKLGNTKTDNNGVNVTEHCLSTVISWKSYAKYLTSFGIYRMCNNSNSVLMMCIADINKFNVSWLHFVFTVQI